MLRSWVWPLLLACELALLRSPGCTGLGDTDIGSYEPGSHHDQHARNAYAKTHGFKVHQFEVAAVAAASGGNQGRMGSSHSSDETGVAVGPNGVLFNGSVPFEMSRGYRVYSAEVPPWVGQPDLSRKQLLKWLKGSFAQADDIRSAIRRRYGGGYEHGQWDKIATKLFGPPSSGKEKDLEMFTHDIEERIASRMLFVLLGPPSERQFTFAFTGHSNAAGHGNYFDDTYPFAMARDLSEAFSQAGLRLAVQNFAAGGTSTIPTAGFCGRTAVGDAVDVSSWDFAMTEGGGKGQKQGESWIRSMLSLERRPAAGLLFVDSGNRAKKWASHYRAVGAFHSLSKIEKGLPLASNDTRGPEALQWLHPDCQKFGENGTPRNTYCRQKKWGPANDEMRWAPGRKGKLEAAVYDSNGKKLGGSCPGMVSWHDGYKLHHLKGAVLAHFYTRCLQLALRRLMSDIHNLPETATPEDVTAALAKIRGDIAVANRRRPLPVPGADCKATHLCPHIGRLRCATANEPRVGAALVGFRGEGVSNNKDQDLSGSSDSAQNTIKPDLDSFNKRKLMDERTCT